jgi:Ca2+-binding EF-hand superfamily protein
VILPPKRELSQRELREVKLAFELYDLRGSGKISREDAIKAMQVLGYKINKEDQLMLNTLLATAKDQEVTMDTFSYQLPSNIIQSTDLTFDDFKLFAANKIVNIRNLFKLIVQTIFIRIVEIRIRITRRRF